VRFRHLILILTLSGTCAIFSSAFAGGKIGSRLAAVLQTAGPDDEVAVWVYFTDKGRNELMKGAVPRDLVSGRSIQRRLNVRPESDVVDYTDLPVERSYAGQIASHVRQVRQQSKWFNAVSALTTKSQIAEFEGFPFVGEVDLLARFKRNQTERETASVPPASAAARNRLEKAYALDYGASFGQLNIINVPAIHEKGNYGQGVIVGVFDNGFRLLTHEAFSSMNILATRDFVDHKTSVVPDNQDPGYGSHGVNTLSTIGGYMPGRLIGPAFGATYILARTENDSSETPIEEDNWVAAIEWADSIGVQVTTTSLAYLEYDAPYKSWTWEDMNGNTLVITRAAEMAVRKGIVVLNSAGNEGLNSNHNTLWAPADGDSVITVGAVDPNGIRSSFSSVGPTTSVPPRIKPDIMAQGSQVLVASSTATSGYIYSQGTSFSCPLAAGVAALMIHDHPKATPAEVANAMRTTASRAGSPDNSYGWGIIDAVASINYLDSTGSDVKPTTYTLDQNYPNPFNPATIIGFRILHESPVTITVYNPLGEKVRVLLDEVKPAGKYAVTFDGSQLPSGVYYYRLLAAGYSEARKMILLK
jgi:serine protease AprX